MKIQGTQLHHVTIDISNNDLLKHTLDLIGLDGCWIENGNLCKDGEYYHGTPPTEIIRVATEDDIQRLAVRRYLKGMIK